MITRSIISVVFPVLWAAVSGCASHRATGTHRMQVENEAVVTVQAMDVANRLVTVSWPTGDSMTVYVDKSNKRFPQASVGDRVRIRYTESIALRLAKTGTSAAGISVTESVPPAHSREAAERAAVEATAHVKIEAVNSDGSLVVFTGPRGRRAVQVRDSAMKEYVRSLRVGDNVEVTYKEAVALTLEKVKT